MALRFISPLGLAGLSFIAWLGSEDRQRVPWKIIQWGIGVPLRVGLVIRQRILITILIVLCQGRIDGLYLPTFFFRRKVHGRAKPAVFSQVLGRSGQYCLSRSSHGSLRRQHLLPRDVGR
jgi:hypothetical protein